MTEFLEVRGSPEEEEPPYAVGEELAHDEGPGLAIAEAVDDGEVTHGMVLLMGLLGRGLFVFFFSFVLVKEKKKNKI